MVLNFERSDIYHTRRTSGANAYHTLMGDGWWAEPDAHDLSSDISAARQIHRKACSRKGSAESGSAACGRESRDMEQRRTIKRTEHVDSSKQVCANM